MRTTIIRLTTAATICLLIDVYSVQAQPFTLAPLGVSSNALLLQLTGPTNRPYQIESSTDLSNWSILFSTNSATATSFLISDAALGSSGKRFYRGAAGAQSFGAGQGLFPLQGLRSNTLVAGKTTALRMFCDSLTYSRAAQIQTTVLRPDGSQAVSNFSAANFVPVATSSLGPSLAVLLPGNALPWVGGYNLLTKVLDSRGGLLAQYNYDQFNLL